MSIAARNAILAGKRLPYDAEVEYLQGTGTQYIDTGIAPESSLVVKTTFMYMTPVVGWGVFFGTGTGDKPRNNILARHFAASTSELVCWFGQTSDPNTPRAVIDTTSFHDLELFYGGFKFDNTPYSFASSASISTTAKMYLFAGNNGGFWRGQSCRFKTFSVSKNGTSLLDFIPVRFTNENGVTEGAMFDRVSGKLYRNQGTGAFVIGPDASAANGGGYKRQCVRRSHTRSWRPSARLCSPRLWKEVA